jgi:hypothetical protein
VSEAGEDVPAELVRVGTRMTLFPRDGLLHVTGVGTAALAGGVTAVGGVVAFGAQNSELDESRIGGVAEVLAVAVRTAFVRRPDRSPALLAARVDRGG